MARGPWWLRCTSVRRMDGRAIATFEIDKRFRAQLIYWVFVLYLLGEVSKQWKPS
jgi:hypothetical protein